MVVYLCVFIQRIKKDNRSLNQTINRIKETAFLCYQKINNQYRRSYKRQDDFFSFILRKFAG
ncbi:hypothetical protein [Tenacibaculum sp. A30]|uniref:hypothetical protein n=1 Tax=Tenacibaculum sp. A30 TaxID=3442644 RepID=UPI003EBC5080